MAASQLQASPPAHRNRTHQNTNPRASLWKKSSRARFRFTQRTTARKSYYGKLAPSSSDLSASIIFHSSFVSET